MAYRVAINGFGRIGRLTLRALLEKDPNDIKVVEINDLGNLDGICTYSNTTLFTEPLLKILTNLPKL